MKFFVSTGEASGDLHLSYLVKSVKARYKDVDFVGVAGEKSQKEGVEILQDINELAIMGFTEVLKKYKFLKQKAYEYLQYIKDNQIKNVILVDYGGFNVKFLELLKNEIKDIKVLPQSYLMKKFIFETKCYTEKEPDFNDEKTISLGIEAARLLSRVDVGQTVVCRDRAVIAVEGIEGTDETLKRAGQYSDKDNILIKMSRPQQDMRVDVPVIGLNTVETAIKNGFKGIVAQAKKMIFLNQKECIELANKNNIFIVGKKI